MDPLVLILAGLIAAVLIGWTAGLVLLLGGIGLYIVRAWPPGR